MIDAHVHVWQLGRNGCTWPDASLPGIHRDFAVDDALAEARANGIDDILLVQSQEAAADTEWLLDQAAGHHMVAGVVGWTDIGDAHAVESLAAENALRGLRPMVQDREADWYDRPELDAGFAAMASRGIVLDALVRPQHLASLERLARRHPQLRIVIDHGAKPDPAGDLAAWNEAMRSIARCPNVACKLSGLLTELAPGQPGEAVAPVFTLLWDAFGADRLIWGSDWPVLTLAGTYAGWLDQARALVPTAHQNAVFGGNARQIYGLAR
ncbi:amidohydrolase family protein [Stakelama marina]|uniref:Amidohydrolase family protein n=1 Tax=Stakelama marina TaxID=2826939 RepID=A0A8T4IKB9_9SPHN|nr:amidohydrolase family protein [Stakelama marina]MBR0552799.1 amidohydrolase family protein [Stakelama marina]